ncbi:MAG: acyl carrier protein [Verrucomicrobia bacterium]|nr:acyl carrier protein [Pseudomonadota bacterium]MBS0630528.1 acyl carrier protein [Verrucomicrobiota bacterium]
MTLPTSPEQKLRSLPAPARAAYQRFKDNGDPAALDEVIMAILADFIPRAQAGLLATATGESRLIEDLGFDSLAITEVVFFTEDLFGISIGNQELVQIRTLDELRQFVRKKISERPAA